MGFRVRVGVGVRVSVRVSISGGARCVGVVWVF